MSLRIPAVGLGGARRWGEGMEGVSVLIGKLPELGGCAAAGMCG